MASTISSPSVGCVSEQDREFFFSQEDQAATTHPPEFSNRVIVVVIPAYNEERFIGSVVLKTRFYVPHVIVVDDGSSDATAQIAKAAGATVLQHPSNLGKGAALRTAFRAARQIHPDVVVMLDADYQHLPEEINKVAQPVLDNQADISIGSRYLNQACQVPRLRVMGHWVFNWLTRAASGVPSSDSQSGFRAFSPRALECIDFSSHGFSVECEMQFQARQHDLKLAETCVDIRYPDKSKRSVIAQGMAVLKGVLKLTLQYRPLLCFGLTGLLFMSVGIPRHLASDHAPLSILLSMVGLVLVSTGFTLHSLRALLVDLLQGRK